jgi:hypothetical protein
MTSRARGHDLDLVADELRGNGIAVEPKRTVASRSTLRVSPRLSGGLRLGSAHMTLRSATRRLGLLLSAGGLMTYGLVTILRFPRL